MGKTIGRKIGVSVGILGLVLILAFVCKMVRLDRSGKCEVDSDLATLVSLGEDKTISEAAKEYFIEYMCEIAAQGKFVE